MTKKKQFPNGSVCKPCWELKYCPYGPLVEDFPSAGAVWTSEEMQRRLEEVKRRYQEALSRLIDGQPKSEKEVWLYIELLHTFQPDNWEYIQQFEADEVNCKIFGHACPAFFVQSGGTETVAGRVQGRNIPRVIMLKVVRRDNHVCQLCHKYVPDDKVEFDHIIPYSRGGPTSVENIRLLCRDCNRKKSNSMEGLLIER